MADDMHEDGREIWDVPAPPGGWGQPWPQCIELAMNLPAQHWTLVGGLMVQLHSARAALAVTRPTADVDIVLHVETPATTRTFWAPSSSKAPHTGETVGTHAGT